MNIHLDTPSLGFIADPSTPVRAYATRAYIDLGGLRHNARLLRRMAQPAKIMAVVKADAYGHGAVPVATTLQEEGYDHFMVATLSEALHLRRHGIQGPILVAMPPLPDNLPVYSQENFHVSASTRESCNAILDYAHSGNPLNVHVKIDTGMHRLGLYPNDALDVIPLLQAHPSINIQGIWTHLATAGSRDVDFSTQQIAEAQHVLSQLGEGTLPLHVGNSSALMHPQKYLHPSTQSMYRVGGGLLGISAMPERAREIGLVPILTLASYVLTIKTVAKGETVSYGRTWKARVTPELQ